MVICGSSRRSLENPLSRNPSPSSVSKYRVLTSKSTRLAGPSPVRAAQAAEDTSIAAGRPVKAQHPVRVLQRIEQELHPRRRNRQRPAAGPFLAGPVTSRPRSSTPCPAASRCRATAFSSSSSTSSCAEPRCSISRDPR